MRRHLTILMATALLLTACASPENSQEYRDLEDVVAGLEGRVDDLTGQVASARSAFEAVSADVQTLVDLRAEVGGMQTDSADRSEEVSGLQEDISALEADEETLTVEAAGLQDQVDDAMGRSSAFRRWVSDQNRNDERWDCAMSVAVYFLSWGAFKASPELLMDEPPPESDLLRRGRDHLGLSPGDGCDGWHPGNAGTFWSATTVFDKMCETIDTELLTEAPEDAVGSCWTGWGHVTFFDQANEPCRLDADIGPTNVSLSSYEVWTEFKDPSQVDCDWLFALDRGDEFRWWAIADGIVTATDDEGTTAMIPTFTMLRFVYLYRV